MVVDTRQPDLSDAALGLLLLFNSINLKLLVSNLFVIIVVLLPPQRPELVGPALLVAFVLMFLEETLSVLGLWCCARAPVGGGFRAVAFAAFALMALSMIVTLGFFLPQLLRQTLGGDARDPTQAWSLALTLGTTSHVIFFVFLWRLARVAGRPALALWPFLLLAGALLLAVGGGVTAVFSGVGPSIAVLWIGSSILLCAHGYYLLILRQAVAEAGTGNA
jgi:hypothetical protein